VTDTKRVRADAELEARLALVLANAPRSLLDAELELVRQCIARSLSQRRSMRVVPLENGDEPACGHDPVLLGSRRVEDRAK
jgi:hypothetical protein